MDILRRYLHSLLLWGYVHRVGFADISLLVLSHHLEPWTFPTVIVNSSSDTNNNTMSNNNDTNSNYNNNNTNSISSNNNNNSNNNSNNSNGGESLATDAQEAGPAEEQQAVPPTRSDVVIKPWTSPTGAVNVDVLRSLMQLVATTVVQSPGIKKVGIWNIEK